MLKCPYDQILDTGIHFFHIFEHNRSFRGILPNFNLLHLLKNTTQVEIIITISVENCKNIIIL